MKRARLNTLQMHFASVALLMTAMLVPLFWPVVANADLFSDLKKAVEKVVAEELEKAVDETKEQPSTQENNQYVGQVQYFLHLLGYDIGTMMGYLTPETSSAIRAFQADQGLPVDGLVTESLALALAVSFQEALLASTLPGAAGSQTTTSPPTTTSTQTAPAPAQAEASPAQTPPPTPVQDQAATSTTVTVAGLTVPEQWTTIENGIVVPHPLKKDGRVLTLFAIAHYAANIGLTADKEALYALGEYLVLAALREDPAVIERTPVRYAMFLTENERRRYLCWEKSSACEMFAGGGITWAGNNEFETRRNRQAFIDDYRDRLVAVAAKQPIDFLDVGLILFGQYDQAKRGFGLTSFPVFRLGRTPILGPHHRSYPTSREGRSPYLAGRNPFIFFSYDPAPDKTTPNLNQGNLSEFKPMSESDAGSLVNRMWPPPECASRPPTNSMSQSTGGTAIVSRLGSCRWDPRTAHVVLHQTLTDFRPGHDRFAGKFVVTAAVAYEDPLFERELHNFSLGNSAPKPVAVAPSTGGTAIAAVSALPASRITDGIQPVSLPILNGDVAVTIDSTVLSREELKNRPDYRKHLAFAYLGKHPDILDHSPVAQSVAAGYLTDDAKSQYLNLRGASPAQFYSWKGENEFYHERMSQTFVDDYRSSLVAAAPKMPFDIWVVEERPLRSYDFNRVGYELPTPLVAQRARVNYKGENYGKEIPGLGSVIFDTSNFNSIVSDFMPMDAGRAEDLTNKLTVRNNQRQIYYGARLRIKDVILDRSFRHQLDRLKNNKDELPRYDGWRFDAVAEIKSLGVYVDPELTQLIYQFNLSK